jgi:hypothetical protein
MSSTVYTESDMRLVIVVSMILTFFITSIVGMSSCAEVGEFEPVPGDLIVALHTMRAWEDEFERGLMGEHVQAGEQAFVVSTWSVGNQRRMKLLREDRLLVFSCANHCVCKNWRVVRAGPRLPTPV